MAKIRSTSMVVTLRLNSVKDATLINYLSIVSPRSRSKVIRSALRDLLNAPPAIAADPPPVPEGKQVVLQRTEEGDLSWSYVDIDPIA